MRLMIKVNQENIVNYLIVEIAMTAIKFFVIQGIPGGYVYNSIANIIMSMILILIMVPSLITAYIQNQRNTFIFIIIFLLVLLFQLIIFPENASNIASNIIKMIGMSLGCLISANALIDYKLFYNKLVKISKLIICFGVFEFFTHEFMGVVGSDQAVDYDMSFGFFLVVPVVIQFAEICTDKASKNLDRLFFLLGIVMVVLMGSRGATLAIFVGCMLSFYAKSRLRNLRDILIVVLGIGAAFVLYLNYRTIAVFFYELLIQNGIKSRLLSMMAYGDVAYLAGRDTLRDAVFVLISRHPIIGSGIFSNTSSHNIFLEVILFYGYPIGIIIICFIIFQWLKILFEDDYYKRKLMAIFLSYATVDSLLNLTVLGKDMFWIYLGLAMSTRIRLKKKGKIK